MFLITFGLEEFIFRGLRESICMIISFLENYYIYNHISSYMYKNDGRLLENLLCQSIKVKKRKMTLIL